MYVCMYYVHMYVSFSAQTAICFKFMLYSVVSSAYHQMADLTSSVVFVDQSRPMHFIYEYIQNKI